MKEWEIPQIPEWGEANKPKAIEFLKFLDGELAQRAFIAGDSYSIADITGLIAVDFMKPARIQMPPECMNVLRWYKDVSSRPSAAA
jgi:glutathione S-transferase